MSQDRDTLEHEAKQLGLTRLSEKHVAQLARAKAAAEGMRGRIPRDLHWSDEPAHTFRASEEA